MSCKEVFFILLDQYADWEGAPLAPVISQSPGWGVKTAAPQGKPVRSIGGFVTVPDCGLANGLPESCAGIVLVGGMSWRSDAAKAVAPLVFSALERNIAVGAICDATVFLAALGVLDRVPHTGNMLEDMQTYAGARYAGAEFYRHQPAVRSGSLVTANGCAAMDFAREMIVALGLLSEEESSRWYRLFKYGFYEAPEEAAWWFQRLNAGRG